MPSKSTYWGPAMTESQYAVFHFDVKKMTMRGNAPMIIDGLDAATSYCQQKIADTRAMGCRIYDRDGNIVRTFSDAEVYQKNHGRPAAKRSVIIGSACLLAGVGGVALDAWLEWRLTFGVLLGARFLWVGSVKLSEGIAGLMDERAGR
jgi:hypothetical protein